MESLNGIHPKDLLSGTILPMNKPLGWTSFDVVGKLRIMIRNILEVKKIKVGHAGTLDPLATGLLIICTGIKTKEIEGLQNLEKEYTGTIVLGATTPSYDLETEFDAHYPYNHIKAEDINNAAKKFTGSIMQLPPVFSAIKIKGKRAYQYARKNQAVELKPREVKIHEFIIENIDIPLVKFRVVCSKGTYIRSLAHDFGKSLNSGAYLKDLCRTRIGNYQLNDAFSIKSIQNHLENM